MRFANQTRKCASPWCTSAAWAGIGRCLECQRDLDLRRNIVRFGVAPKDLSGTGRCECGAPPGAGCWCGGWQQGRP